MRNKGKELRRELKLLKLKEIYDFKQPNEHFVKNGLGYDLNSLPKPWDEVSKALMRYVTLEGQHKIVYAYHFALLSHFRYPKERKLISPSLSFIQ